MPRLAMLPLALFAAALPLRADPPTDLAGIEAEVAQFAGTPPAQPIDRRLRLAPCPVAAELSWYGARRATVLVRCPVAPGWRLFVPVGGGAQAGGTLAEAAIRRGDPVTIVVEGEGFALSQAGEALEGGAPGSWIRVRPLAGKGDVLRARVLRPGRVGISLP